MQNLGSLRVLRGALVGCALAGGAQFACTGQPPDDGAASGGTASGAGGASGGTASGAGGASGGTASGAGGASGGTSSSGGAMQTSSGGQGEAPAVPNICDDLELDPPCGDTDIYGEWYECKTVVRIRFSLPLTTIAAPAEDLRVVFLPLDSDLGAGGMGGSSGLIEASLDLLEGNFGPLGAGDLHGETFDLLYSAYAMNVSVNVTDGVPTDYVEVHELGQYPWEVGVAEVALVQGDTILAQYRLLVDTQVTCLI